MPDWHQAFFEEEWDAAEETYYDQAHARPSDHNHITRDIKKPGKCPECDKYWKKNESDNKNST